jgi:hypothetical protein
MAEISLLLRVWDVTHLIAIYTGYRGSPGTRTMTGTFPYFVQFDNAPETSGCAALL